MTAIIQDEADISIGATIPDPRKRAGEASSVALTDLGIWLSGLESFLSPHQRSFFDTPEATSGADFSQEFRLVHSVLQRCSILTARILSGRGHASEVYGADVGELGTVLRNSILSSAAALDTRSTTGGNWKAWSTALLGRFERTSAFTKLIRAAEIAGEKNLPAPLLNFVQSESLPHADHAELVIILPRFAKILTWLSVVGKMLETDEPLKPALLIFSRVNEQIFELTTYINNRLARLPSEDADLFASLDAASYTASIELKKVYSQELSGLSGMRSTPSIYARIETAHSLLNDGFQQILAGFARSVGISTDLFELFPGFKLKLERSLVLREDLKTAASVVQAAEKDPGKKQIQNLHKTLRGFMGGSVRYLFYKDTETVERFIEEVLVTKQNKDLVPILHRFGAFLDTLSGQVNFRAVFEKHRADEQDA